LCELFRPGRLRLIEVPDSDSRASEIRTVVGHKNGGLGVLRAVRIAAAFEVDEP
jgi:hypothetical protein